MLGQVEVEAELSMALVLQEQEVNTPVLDYCIALEVVIVKVVLSNYFQVSMSKVRQEDFMHLFVLVSNKLCAEDLLTRDQI